MDASLPRRLTPLWHSRKMWNAMVPFGCSTNGMTIGYFPRAPRAKGFSKSPNTLVRLPQAEIRARLRSYSGL